MTDLTPRQAIYAYLGGEPVEPQVLRAAVAQYVCAYDTIVDLASDAVDDPDCHSSMDDLASEILMQQTLLEEYLVLTQAATVLPDLVRSRRATVRSAS
ncbi:hypothetical protein [Rhizobium sp. LCM 4573]|uniref:hypothetical protein n=1 Tax=Rhizobium sp. LCM 4573 TaxID=1848291 RepID=UPI0008DA7732|nr:hypothetical protein [Rhizobium sp. LCM 4573]OHV83680.1 hypothetical protein LCM4573_06120 [Rhizobium sp. LCM 4573]